MTKKKVRVVETSKEQEAELFDVFLPFEEPVEGVKAPETFDGEEYEHGGVRLKLDSSALKLFKRAYESFLASRRIPTNPDNIGVSHPMVLIAASQTANEAGKEMKRGNKQILYRVQQYYTKLMDEANLHAMTLGLSYKNVFTNEPTPYTAEDDVDFDPEVFEWEQSEFRLPPPQYDLTNPYEKRLKQFSDIIEQAGFMYRLRLNDLIEDAVLTMIRIGGIGEDTDPDGFHDRATGGTVSDTDGPDDESEGN